MTEQQDVIKHLNERIVELEHADTDGRFILHEQPKWFNDYFQDQRTDWRMRIAKARLRLSQMSLQNKLAGKEKIRFDKK